MASCIIFHEVVLKDPDDGKVLNMCPLCTIKTVIAQNARMVNIVTTDYDCHSCHVCGSFLKDRVDI